MRGEVSSSALDLAAAVGGGAVGCFFSAAGIVFVVPSRATMKLVLHFGQRIFIPLSGMRRSSTSYCDLHDTHSTLIMFLRAAFEEDSSPARAPRERSKAMRLRREYHVSRA
jgi:hypothetical protein